MSIEYNGVNIFDDGDAPSDVVIERGSDGSGVFFHVCCGCHKTHAVTVRSGLLAFTMRYEMPNLADAEKIAASVSAVKEKDLLVCERANDDARAEIARLNARLDDVYGTDPCSKCGCKLVVRAAEIAALRAALKRCHDLIQVRAKLEAVCDAASATQRAFEERADCPDCDAKADAMGGRVDPLCDVCMERWAVSHDAVDDALAAAREGEK